MDAKEREFKVPKDIEELADKLAVDIANKKKAKEDKEAERKKAAILAAKKNQEAGLPYAREIFQWAKQFENSEAGKKLLRIGNIYADNIGVCFFNGYVKGAMNRRLGICKEGVWFHSFGCGATMRVMKSPEELALHIQTPTLMLACEWIKNGRAWECIKETLLQRFE